MSRLPSPLTSAEDQKNQQENDAQPLSVATGLAATAKSAAAAGLDVVETAT
jgi:hypothetical protein